jgi:PAS domain S-box-containing protein
MAAASESGATAAEVAGATHALPWHAPSLQLIYDTAPIGLAYLSPDCRYIHLNQRLTEICGLSVEAHLGRYVRDCVPALADAVEAIVKSVVETGEPVTGVEVAGQRPDQTEERFWVTYWHPVRGPDGAVVGVNVAAEEITERKQREAHIRFIADELSHRTKNLLAVVTGIARRTAQGAGDVDQFLESFAARLSALSQCHDLLVRDNWYGSPISELVAAQLKPFGEVGQGRIQAGGPPLTLRPNAVQHLGLAIHELATNAAKHGALSNATGLVSVGWDLDRASHTAQVRWAERGGPPVAPPRRRGFGHVVIDQIVPRALAGRGVVEYRPEGVRWTFEFPFDEDAPPDLFAAARLAGWKALKES